MGYSDKIFNCLVDNEACVSLIRSSVVRSLSGVEVYSSPIRTISGLGHKTIKVSQMVNLSFHFRGGFITKSDDSLVVPSKFLEESLVLDVPLLRANNLLPDMLTYQLLYREVG